MIAAALLALIPLFQDDAAPVLLPPAPDGWRFERLEFPLTFAPELEFEGMEELYFAPGMFDAESPSYFSYVLDIRLDEPADVPGGEVDEAFLRSFLERYYRGLCRSVGEGRGLTVVAEEITAKVTFDGRRYLADIAMMDPFITGGPLQLRLEIDLQPGVRTTEIFGLASPAPRDAEVWNELRDIRSAWRLSRPVPVLFNHLYVIPDSETFEALSKSPFLKREFAIYEQRKDEALCRSPFLTREYEYAVHEQRKTVGADMTNSGIYFYGRNTYFCFLTPGEDLETGHTGLAFGVEVAGGTQLLTRALAEQDFLPFYAVISRRVGSDEVPWFLMIVHAAHRLMRMELFSLEYDPAFLAGWHARDGDAGGISRRAVLERYASHLERDPTDALFEDVVAVHMALNEVERNHLFALSRAFGYEVEETDAGWTCRAPGYRILISASDDPGGITGFDLSLRRAVERETMTFGKATLTLDGKTASMRFAF